MTGLILIFGAVCLAGLLTEVHTAVASYLEAQ